MMGRRVLRDVNNSIVVLACLVVATARWVRGRSVNTRENIVDQSTHHQQVCTPFTRGIIIFLWYYDSTFILFVVLSLLLFYDSARIFSAPIENVQEGLLLVIKVLYIGATRAHTINAFSGSRRSILEKRRVKLPCVKLGQS